MAEALSQNGTRGTAHGAAPRMIHERSLGIHAINFAESTMASDRASNKPQQRNAALLWNIWLAARRFGFRPSVWWHALEGRPRRLLRARIAAWSPADLSYNEGAAMAAKD
ncbi:hypothetical protein BN77_0558 [Rhizobium mesoamericanum STM3625]|uniref:Uncharacterized protein n=1 Tax=Rhizobium mesoamericanum STM3625 TaxID=1211777 RepID=K0Q0V8_9HYPH|nr:hypothetical protein BN77_0558 [Rhizobium mesoamericanum STM3625]